jgi:hypothetical protein
MLHLRNPSLDGNSRVEGYVSGHIYLRARGYPRLPNTSLEGGNELLDRMANGLIMRQAMDNPVKHDIHDFQAAELELAFKEIG